MSHYEERLERDLSLIKQQASLLAKRVDEALSAAVRALLSGDDKLAYATVLGDQWINAQNRKLDRMCHAFIGVHLPSAGHLRLMTAMMHANVALERVGDYAVTIARESVHLAKRPDALIKREVELLAGESRQMFKQAICAFLDGNAEKARATMIMADQVERTFDVVFADLVTEGENFSIEDLFAYLGVFNSLERVSDQAKNICEETVFAVTGHTKANKAFRILFIDDDNTLLGPIAETVARKNFPEGGEFHSLGRQAGALAPDVVRLLQDAGVDLDRHEPRALNLSLRDLADFHVIVSLQGPVKSYVENIPFHTAALEWDVGGAVAADLPDEQRRARYEAMTREIAVQVSNLMSTLRGGEID
ncbi:PhoU domain-containing protein [Candidatus Accumulibacter sp. ACC003]|uniref:PhoU domain-containing protein n=1 Tax=Candidatus Accumulibacter sp. ACC003 TaxID=2823334 RepID=UPI0025C18146|nr:PhoU domain-containing protein [Candidatus Accumulibacter sp. ACC003]